MKLVICVIIDKEVDALLLVEQTFGRGYWFPFDEVRSGESRSAAAKRISSKVSRIVSILRYQNRAHQSNLLSRFAHMILKLAAF